MARQPFAGNERLTDTFWRTKVPQSSFGLHTGPESSMRSSKLIGPLLVVALAMPCGAQPTRVIGKPDVEFSEPFTQLNGVRELKDGRVIATDVRDKVIHLIDFKSGRLSKIGREGSGPKEFGLPMGLAALPGDTSAVYDPLNSRLLLINPDGTPGGFITQSDAGSGGGGASMTVRLAAPSYTDSRGRMYSAAPNFTVGPNGGVESTDSAALLRFDRSTKKTDTVGFIRTPKTNTQVSGNASGGQRVMIRAGAGNPFEARDSWFATPDGKVGVIRAPEYRLDWVHPQRSTGTAIAFSPIKVSEAHKQQWRDTRRNGTAIMITNNNGQRSVSSGAPSAAQVPEPTDWPAVMPPFLNSSRPLVAPNGTVWIRRTTEASEKRTQYDVIDGAGKVIERVMLPPRSTIIGFGKSAMYTLRLDEDDLQYLQRHTMK